MCPVLWKAKHKISEFGVRKGSLIKKAPTENKEDLMVPQIHLALRTRLKVFSGWRNTYMEGLVWQVVIGGPWNLAIYGKGCQHWIFLDNEPAASERVSVFRFWLCSSPFVLSVHEGGGGGAVRLWFHACVCVCTCVCLCVCVRLWFREQPEVKVFSAYASAARHAVLVCCFWRVTQYTVKQDRTILSWFCGYTMWNDLLEIPPKVLPFWWLPQGTK